MSDEDLEALAKCWGKKHWDKLLDLRHKAIYAVYMRYGLAETVRKTGWTKPSVLAFVKKAGAK